MSLLLLRVMAIAMSTRVLIKFWNSYCGSVFYLAAYLLLQANNISNKICVFWDFTQGWGCFALSETFHHWISCLTFWVYYSRHIAAYKSSYLVSCCKHTQFVGFPNQLATQSYVNNGKICWRIYRLVLLLFSVDYTYVGLTPKYLSCLLSVPPMQRLV